MRVAASSNLAAIISACWCRGGTGEVYDPRGELGKLQTFVVKSTPDAQRLAQATERAGATVHASWIGDIALAAPIRVGPSTRLSISGDGRGARVTGPPPAQYTSTVYDVAENDAGAAGLFEVAVNGSLRLDNLFLFMKEEADEGGESEAAEGVEGHGIFSDRLLYLHSESLVSAHGCTFFIGGRQPNRKRGQGSGQSVADHGAAAAAESRNIRAGAVHVSAGARLELYTGCSVVTTSTTSTTRSAVFVDHGGVLIAQGIVFRHEPSPPRPHQGSVRGWGRGGVFLPGYGREAASSTGAGGGGAYAGAGASSGVGGVQIVVDAEILLPAAGAVVHLAGATATLTDCQFLHAEGGVSGSGGNEAVIAGRKEPGVRGPNAFATAERYAIGPHSSAHPNTPLLMWLEEGSEVVSTRTVFNGLLPLLVAPKKAAGDPMATASKQGPSEQTPSEKKTSSSYYPMSAPPAVVVSQDSYFLSQSYYGTKEAETVTAEANAADLAAAAVPRRDGVSSSIDGVTDGLAADWRTHAPATGGSGNGGGGGDGGGGGIGVMPSFSPEPTAVGARRVARMAHSLCPKGYQGSSCRDCAAGYVSTVDGECDRCSANRERWGMLWAVTVAMVGTIVILLCLDAVRNGKSPPRRVAQIWRRIRCCRPRPTSGAGVWDEGGGANDLVTVGLEKSSGSLTSTWATGAGTGVGVGGGLRTGGWFGRDALGRFLQGGMVFIATVQIVTQGVAVLELRVPFSMTWTLGWLKWTNLDPASAAATRCFSMYSSSVFDRFAHPAALSWHSADRSTWSIRHRLHVRYPRRRCDPLAIVDRVDGTIGLVTAYLVLLLVSYASTSLCDPCLRPKLTSSCKYDSSTAQHHHQDHHHKHQHSFTFSTGRSRDGGSRRLDDLAYPVPFGKSTRIVGAGSTGARATRGAASEPRGAGGRGMAAPAGRRVSGSMMYPSSRRQGLSGVEAGLEGGGFGGGAQWDRWDRWTSWERHACGLVVVCLLMHPVVCTTLLQVFDCGHGYMSNRGDIIRCLTGKHKTYQSIAWVFLVLYGVGLPATVLTMILKAARISSRGEREVCNNITTASIINNNNNNNNSNSITKRQGSAVADDTNGSNSAINAGGKGVMRAEGRRLAWGQDRLSIAVRQKHYYHHQQQLQQQQPQQQQQTLQLQQQRDPTGILATPSPDFLSSSTNSDVDVCGAVATSPSIEEDEENVGMVGESGTASSAPGRRQRYTVEYPVHRIYNTAVNDELEVSDTRGMSATRAMRTSSSRVSVAHTLSAVATETGAFTAGRARQQQRQQQEAPLSPRAENHLSGATTAAISSDGRSSREGTAAASAGRLSLEDGCSFDSNFNSGSALDLRHDAENSVGEEGGREDLSGRNDDDDSVVPDEMIRLPAFDQGAGLEENQDQRHRPGGMSVPPPRTRKHSSQSSRKTLLLSDVDASMEGSGLGVGGSYARRRRELAAGWPRGDYSANALNAATSNANASGMPFGSSSRCCWCGKCVGKVWEWYGRGVLRLAGVMSAAMNLSSVSRMGSNNSSHQLREGPQWRSTIPLWSPYRPSRYWFGVWDLGRRFLLTGFLSLIPVGDDGIEACQRAAVGCAVAALSLVVGEAALPHHDPWISWTYRTGGVLILLVNSLGLLQKVGTADVHVALATLVLLFSLILVVCVCGGWRLSCAERTAAAATVTAASASASASADRISVRANAATTTTKPQSIPAERPLPPSSGDVQQHPPQTELNARVSVHNITTTHSDMKQWITAGVPRERVNRVREESGAFEGGWPTASGGVRFAAPRAGGKPLSGSVRLSPSYLDLVKAATPRGKDGMPNSDDRSAYVNPIFKDRQSPCKVASTPAAAGALATDALQAPPPAAKGSSTRREDSSRGVDRPKATAFDRFLLSKSPDAVAGVGFNSVGGGGGGCSSGGRAGASASIDRVRSFGKSNKTPGKTAIEVQNQERGTSRHVGGTSMAEVGEHADSDAEIDAGAGAGAGTSFGRVGGYRDGTRTCMGSYLCETSHSRTRSTSVDSDPVGIVGTREGSSDASPDVIFSCPSVSSASSSSHSRLLDRVLGSRSLATGGSGGRNWAFGNNGKRGIRSSSSTSGSSVGGKVGRSSRRFRRRGNADNSNGILRSSSGRGVLCRNSSSFGSTSADSSLASSQGLPPVLPPLDIGRGASSVVSRPHVAVVPGAASSDCVSGSPSLRRERIASAVTSAPSSEAVDNATGSTTARQSATRNSGCWPLAGSSSASPAMPAWWLNANRGANTTEANKASIARSNGGGVAVPRYLAAAAHARAEHAELEANAARVEAAFGEGSDGERGISSRGAGINVTEFIEFVRAGGSGMSCFDSRSSFDSREAGGSVSGRSEYEYEDDEDSPSPPSSDAPGRGRRGGGGGGAGVRWVGDGKVFRSQTPLTSAELRHQFDFDFEDDEDEEDAVSFLRLSNRFQRMGGRTGTEGGTRGGEGCRQKKRLAVPSIIGE